MITYSAHEHAIAPGGTSPASLIHRSKCECGTKKHISASAVQDQFVRIASARLASRYKFEPQRRAIAARMFIEWLRRKEIND